MYKMSTNTQEITYYQKNRDKMLNRAKEYYQKKNKKKKKKIQKKPISQYEH